MCWHNMIYLHVRVCTCTCSKHVEAERNIIELFAAAGQGQYFVQELNQKRSYLPSGEKKKINTMLISSTQWQMFVICIT